MTANGFVRTRATALTVLVALLISCVNAFSPSLLTVSHTTTAQRRPSPRTLLNLHPEQGSQLQAAWTASVAKAQQNMDDAASSMLMSSKSLSSTINASAAARSFVSRVFSLPSALIRRHPHPSAEGFDDHFPTASHERGVVLYPIVGFQFVPDSENHCRVLPNSVAPRCSIYDTRNEELVGWWCAGCYLDMLDEDIAHAPRLP